MPYRPTANYRECLHLNEIPDATSTEAGMMSAADKAKLDTLAASGTPLTLAAQVSEQPARGARRHPRTERNCTDRPVCTIRWQLTLFAFKLDIRVSVPCGRLKIS